MGSRTDGEQLTKGQLWTENIGQFVGLRAFSKMTCGFACYKPFFFLIVIFYVSLHPWGTRNESSNGPGKRREIYKRWSSFKTLDSFGLPAPKLLLGMPGKRGRETALSTSEFSWAGGREQEHVKGFAQPGSFPLCQNSVTLWESRHLGRTQSWKLLLQRLLLTW